MPEPRNTSTIEQRIRDLKEKLDTYLKGPANPTPEVLADLARGVHELGDHLIALHRRVEKLEENTPQWTTRGWEPPPGGDQGSFVVREE